MIAAACKPLSRSVVSVGKAFAVASRNCLHCRRRRLSAISFRPSEPSHDSAFGVNSRKVVLEAAAGLLRFLARLLWVRIFGCCIVGRS